MFCTSGCSKVGAETATAAGTSCPKLSVVNFNYTAVTPVSLVPLLTGCSELTVLKLAGIQNWVASMSIPRSPYPALVETVFSRPMQNLPILL
jgi:hypothetical protein